MVPARFLKARAGQAALYQSLELPASDSTSLARHGLLP
jgi:hypothetical protein